MSDITQSSMAVLIDYENLALGTGRRKRNGHQEPGPAPDVKRILERLVDKGRIVAKQTFFSEPSVIGNERVDHVKLYLPARTAIVLEATK